MIKYKHKLLAALSVIAIGAAVGGAALLGGGVKQASADDTTYSMSSVLSATSGASLESGSYGGTNYASMVFSGGGSVSYQQDLAYKWMTADGTEYFSMQLAFGDVSFNTFTITFESDENSKTSDDKTTNTLTFTSYSGEVKVKVNDGAETAADVSSSITVSLSKSADSLSGVYEVLLNGAKIGEFENIAGSCAEYSASTIIPLAFSADVDDDKTQNVYFIDLNGQSFALNDDGQIVDNAAPVLALNQDVKFFSLGTAFTLDYTIIDVLAASPTKTMQYYQYEEGSTPNYSSLTTSTYFFETDTMDKYGCEYISIKFTLNDKNSSNSSEVMLSWYADSSDLTTFDGVDYITVGIDNENPSYGCIINDSSECVTHLNESDPAYLAYIEAVEEAGQNLKAGSGEYFYLPSLEDLISDSQTTYSGLNFNIYYKKQDSSSSLSSTSLSYNNLTIETSTAGIYSFKVTATDASGNAMRVYNNGKLVKVTADNVWDFDFIPEFTFTVYNMGATVDEAESENIGYVEQSYSFSDFTIKAISGYSSSYSLYYFSGAYGAFTYDELIEKANSEGGLEEYIGVDGDMYLRKIAVFDSSIDEDDDEEAWDASDNPYYWYGDGESFTPQLQGYYVLRLEVVDSQLWGDKVIAYKVIEVQSEIDEMYGDDYWLQENYVSVIFLGIAALAAVGIVLLFVIKPKDENLDDIEIENIDGKTSVRSGKKKNKKDESID